MQMWNYSLVVSVRSEVRKNKAGLCFWLRRHNFLFMSGQDTPTRLEELFTDANAFGHPECGHQRRSRTGIGPTWQRRTHTFRERASARLIQVDPHHQHSAMPTTSRVKTTRLLKDSPRR